MRQVRTVDSSEVQGEGSYVKVRSPLWDEVKELRRLQAAKDDDGVLELAEDLARRYVLEWNWTDEEGQPLPLPQEMDGRMGALLTADEVGFLIRAVARKDTKN